MLYYKTRTFLEFPCILKEIGSRKTFPQRFLIKYLRLIFILAQFPFSASEMELGYNPLKLNVRVTTDMRKSSESSNFVHRHSLVFNLPCDNKSLAITQEEKSAIRLSIKILFYCKLMSTYFVRDCRYLKRLDFKHKLQIGQMN